MAELADALHSGCSVLTGVQVRLLFRAPCRRPRLIGGRKAFSKGTAKLQRRRFTLRRFCYLCVLSLCTLWLIVWRVLMNHRDHKAKMQRTQRCSTLPHPLVRIYSVHNEE